MKKNKLTISLFSLFIIGCAGSFSSSVSKQIFPLKVGNSFISKKDYFDMETGKFYATKIDTFKIISARIVNNETQYLTNVNGQYVLNRADGYWTENGAVLEAKYPGKVGDTYPSYVKITNEKPPDTVTGYWEIIAIDQQVTVPAGTYNCIEYRSEHKSIINGKIHNRFFAWWSPGAGLIKKDVYHIAGDGSFPLIYHEELLKEELK